MPELTIKAMFKDILTGLGNALAAMPCWEKGFHIFWLLGPFILLIERSPADLWLSILALAFVVRSIIKRDGGRLPWPYDDKVSGNYLSKVGLPAFTIMVALANGSIA